MKAAISYNSNQHLERHYNFSAACRLILATPDSEQSTLTWGFAFIFVLCVCVHVEHVCVHLCGYGV